MKQRPIWFALLAVLIYGAVILAAQSTPFGAVGGNSAVIGYCSVPGYPASPLAVSASGQTLKAWYTASSFSPCSATSESSWADSSGNSNTATAVTGTFTCNSNQLNGQNGLAISGSTVMSLASGVTGTYTTAFVVAKTPSSWSAGQTYTITGSVAQGGFQYKFSANGSSIANQAVNQEGSSVVLVGTTSVPVSTWHQINFNGRIAGGSAMGMRIDRASDCSGTCGAFNVVQNVDRLFTNAHNGGEYGAGLTIAEIFIYGGVSTSGLTADETTYNECYIYGKYGI